PAFQPTLALPPTGVNGYSCQARRSLAGSAAPGTHHATEGTVFVACSTQCFGRYPLDRALRIIGELEFSKVDVAIYEKGPHLRPSEVAADVNLAAHRIRIGPSLTPGAFSVEI